MHDSIVIQSINFDLSLAPHVSFGWYSLVRRYPFIIDTMIGSVSQQNKSIAFRLHFLCERMLFSDLLIFLIVSSVDFTFQVEKKNEIKFFLLLTHKQWLMLHCIAMQTIAKVN